MVLETGGRVRLTLAPTLSRPGSVVYPEAGNGGFRSIHTDVDLVEETRRDRVLAGAGVLLTLRATQCLSAFSLDFETS